MPSELHRRRTKGSVVVSRSAAEAGSTLDANVKMAMSRRTDAESTAANLEIADRMIGSSVWSVARSPAEFCRSVSRGDKPFQFYRC
jgi:hypothetical protein